MEHEADHEDEDIEDPTDRPQHHCEQCGKDMNPLGWILGPVCDECCKANHRAATGGR